MNIIDAIKSGKPFRRHGELAWKVKAPEGDFLRCKAGTIHCLSPDHVIADDWEIQEPSVTITASQFWDAIDSTRLFDAMAKDEGMGGANSVRELARKLGLEP